MAELSVERPGGYWVRVRVTGAGGPDTYGTAQTLAQKLANENPGLTFEVTQDKVWVSVTTHTRR